MLQLFRLAASAGVLAACWLASGLVSQAEELRVFPAGQLPDDPRLGALKDLNGYFPFTPAATPEAWAVRAGELRQQMRVALGLWPEPTRTPLHAQVYDRMEEADYTVEKVNFESVPGYFVTGSLYRPRGSRGGVGPFPAVLCPHGHWPDGRFQNRDDKLMAKEMATGGERFLESGRSVHQAFAVQLARMGCVAFVVDLIGYADSQQINESVVHKITTQRPEMATREDWGFFSPQAETHAQNVFGLQTWSLMRSLDFLTSLPDVDAKRLAVSGASSGGSQTLMMSALDARLAVSFPTVMVSTAMQGGCVCENASLLRIGTGNVEIAALFAPKPMGIVSANDWTKETATKGFPDLQKHWAMLGAPDKVQHWSLTQFPHNFNLPSREKIYPWFNTYLALGLSEESLHEREYRLLTRDQLTVWDAAHPAPPSGPDFERKLLRWLHDDVQAQLAKSPEEFARVAAPGWRVVLGTDGFRPATLEHRREITVQGGGQTFAAMLASRRAEDGSFDLPQITIEPVKRSGRTVLWLDEHGKAGLFAADGSLRAEVVRLLVAGMRVEGVDLFEQGEFLAEGQSLTQTRKVANPREVAAYTFGYNRAVFAQRVQDICATLADLSADRTAVVALDGTGPLAAAALFLRPGVELAALQTAGFRFGNVTDLRDPNFLPGGAKYGDLPGLLTLGAPAKLYLAGEEAATFAAVPAAKQWTLARDASPQAAVDWILHTVAE